MFNMRLSSYTISKFKFNSSQQNTKIKVSVQAGNTNYFPQNMLYKQSYLKLKHYVHVHTPSPPTHTHTHTHTHIHTHTHTHTSRTLRPSALNEHLAKLHSFTSYFPSINVILTFFNQSSKLVSKCKESSTVLSYCKVSKIHLIRETSIKAFVKPENMAIYLPLKKSKVKKCICANFCPFI